MKEEVKDGERIVEARSNSKIIIGQSKIFLWKTLCIDEFHSNQRHE